MLGALVRACLEQRIVVVVVALILLVFGLDASRKLSVDAFPDVTNVQVQIATEAPGSAQPTSSALGLRAYIPCEHAAICDRTARGALSPPDKSRAPGEATQD